MNIKRRQFLKLTGFISLTGFVNPAAALANIDKFIDRPWYKDNAPKTVSELKEYFDERYSFNTISKNAQCMQGKYEAKMFGLMWYENSNNEQKAIRSLWLSINHDIDKTKKVVPNKAKIAILWRRIPIIETIKDFEYSKIIHKLTTRFITIPFINSII